jgi:hypothetical protein
MPISSNTLFHFTNKIEHIINILENDFRPHYSLEDYNVIFSTPPVEYLELAIAMVSFCDIPLSQTGEHLNTYGNYGIGLTKEWGNKQGITPILYTHRESSLVGCIRKLIEKFRIFEDRDELYDIVRFIKPYKGNLWRSNGIKQNVIFYNEREWRYIPLEHKESLPKDVFLNEMDRNRFNSGVAERYSIPFTPNDIRYLIVKDEGEILPLIREIERIKSKYSYDQVKILTTRIITSERIKEDF